MDTLVDFIANFYGPTPYFIIFGILLICGLGVPIPEDITLFAAGVLSYYGLTDVWTMIAVSMLGVLLGDSIIFWLGARYGRKITKKWFFARILPEERLDAVSKQLANKGNRLIFAARFMPGLRAPIFFSVGTLHVPYRVFLFYDGTAALLSVPAIVGAVYYFGDQLDHVVRVIQQIEHGIVFVIFAALIFFGAKWYRKHRKAKKGDQVQLAPLDEE